MALIKKYALEAQSSPEVRLLAEDIIQGLGSKDCLSEIMAIYYFVLNNVRYSNDPRTVELVRRPERLIWELQNEKTPSADCDDLVCLQSALLLSLGREVRAITVAFERVTHKGETQYSHVFLQTREPRSGKWIVLDPVAAEDTPNMLQRVQVMKIWPIA